LAAENKYVFAVQKAASKSEILKEVARVYNVHPLAVNILTVKGKYVQYGKTKGQTKAWKKAIVALPQGEKIEFYHPNA
jgi:large subunit ribosomal protein L23